MKYTDELLEMAYPATFDLTTFASLPSFKARIQYCEERLQRLGSGSSRIAYRVDDEKVLKIAKNKKGIAQNGAEADWNKNNYDCMAKIFDGDTDNYLWIEMEITKKIKASDFKRLTGYTFRDMVDFIHAENKDYVPQKYSWAVDKPEIVAEIRDKVNNDYLEPFYSFHEFLFDYTPTFIQDYTRLANWGIATRDGKEVPVIIDTGASDYVLTKYYGAR